ncbi:MAG: GFA family protein [Rhodothermia bacterium]|nr:GFA family protein [Rhodothermia bacterium]
MGISMTGGCVCGSIRYECTARPLLEYKCHCRACQRASGSGFLPLLWVPIDKIELTANEPRYYGVDCDSGRELKRGFCPDCGSHVMFHPGFPGIVIVVAASLDDPSEFKPDTEIWTSSAQPWDLLDSNLRQYERQFTAEDLPHIFHSD